MATEVGTAYVRLIPSMRGFSAEASKGLKTGLAGPSRKAGADAGDAMGGGVASGLDGSSGKLKSAAGRLGGVFTSALKGVGLTAGVALVGGVISALDQEAAVDKLEAQLGGGPMAKEAGVIAGRLYTEGFGSSVGDVGEGVRTVMQSGLLPDGAGAGEIEALTTQALTFADVMGPGFAVCDSGRGDDAAFRSG